MARAKRIASSARSRAEAQARAIHSCTKGRKNKLRRQVSTSAGDGGSTQLSSHEHAKFARGFDRVAAKAFQDTGVLVGITIDLLPRFGDSIHVNNVGCGSPIFSQPAQMYGMVRKSPIRTDSCRGPAFA
jgi:hypothetical protein